MLINQVAFAKFVSQCLKLPPLIALSVVFNCIVPFSGSLVHDRDVIYPLSAMLFVSNVCEVVLQMLPDSVLSGVPVATGLALKGPG